MAIVEVRPIERLRWHGKTGKDAFARPVTIEAPLSVETGQYATGLTEKERKELEEKTGYDLSPDYVPGKAHPFWNSSVARVNLEHKTNIFDTSRPLDFIKVKMLKANDLIANSMREYEEGKFPHAIFVIYDETEEIEVKATKAAIKRKVIIETSKLSRAKKAELVQILLGVTVRDRSDDFIDMKLDESIESEGPEKILSLLQRDKTRTSTHAMVLEALHKNILRKEGSSYYYMDDQVGFDLESTLDYFSDPKNQALKGQILEKLN